MTTESPTPMGSSYLSSQLNRRPSTRKTLRQPASRPQISRGYPLTADSGGHARQYSLNDSSDDEIPMPMKFSALTKAILNDDASILQSTSPEHNYSNFGGYSAATESAGLELAGTPGFADFRTRERTTSPETQAKSPLPRRIVRLSGTPGSSTLRRTSSLQSVLREHRAQMTPPLESPLDLSTPAQVPRTVRIQIAPSSNLGLSAGSSATLSSRTGSGNRKDGDEELQKEPATIARTQVAINQGSVSRFGPSTVGRIRYGEETSVQGSMRVKRIGNLAGTYLRGPARRGKRRQSEDDQEEPGQYNEDIPGPAFSSQEQLGQILPTEEAVSSQESQVDRASFYASHHRDFASGSPVSTKEAAKATNVPSPLVVPLGMPTKAVEHVNKPISPAKAQPVFRVPAPRPDLPSMHDQENEAPPTFRRNKPASLIHLDKMEKAALRPQNVDINEMKTNVSPQRKPLAPRNQNTPHRAAPPPPKMSILETATAPAGAATTSHARHKRSAIRLNGKTFTRMEIVGRGGSSKVWRVMAENGKVYALKRVSLEDADEGAVRGYKGEIDLLKKLEGNDRVIRILDYEMNDEKQTLSVLMEMGELDFNKILTLRFNVDDAKFDPSFTRHYWREMLECIQAVHDHDIVHSDLKPANFVLAQGRLKLIDFGIANAIQTDETVNVHRDTQIGTPNYMSPESLMDANELPHAKGTISNQPKVMKLGKPSDIWSLGCILYQMSYGRQPFAHISNQMSRCRAIIDWNYAIEYPANGVGGLPLPKSLIRTLKKCLNRDQHQRPSVAELLASNDPFLNPVECDEASFPMTEELLGRILQNVVNKCKDRTPTDAELLSLWPAGYFASLRKTLTS